MLGDKELYRFSDLETRREYVVFERNGVRVRQLAINFDRAAGLAPTAEDIIYEPKRA